MSKNIHHNFPEPKMMSFNVLFCSNKSQFTMNYDNGKQQILSFERLKAEILFEK